MRGRGFFGTKKVQEARESFARKEELLKQEIELEKIKDLQELLNLDNLIKLRNKWVDSEYSFDVNKYIDEQANDDLTITEKAGIDTELLKSYFKQQTTVQIEETRLQSFRDDKIQLDGSTTHSYKMSIEKELRKLHAAKKEMIDAIEDLKSKRDITEVEAAFKILIDQVNDKIDKVNVDINKLYEFNMKKKKSEASNLFQLNGVNINVLTKKFEQFLPDVQQLVDNKVDKQVSEYSDKFRKFLNQNEDFKSFIKLKNLRCLNKGLSPSVCVIRNLDLIRNLEKRFPKLFVSFDTVLRQSTNPKLTHHPIYKDIDVYDLDLWNQANWINREKSSTMQFKNIEWRYVDQISTAIFDEKWLDKIILLPTIRMCNKLDDYLFIDHLPGEKVFELKDREYLSLMKKAHRLHYLPFIELDIMQYFSYFNYSGFSRNRTSSYNLAEPAPKIYYVN